MEQKTADAIATYTGQRFVIEIYPKQRNIHPIKVAGDFDFYQGNNELRRAISFIVKNGFVAGDSLALLVGELKFFDSSFIAAIANGTRMTKARGGAIAIVSPDKHFRQVMQITGFNSLISTYNTLDDMGQGKHAR